MDLDVRRIDSAPEELEPYRASIIERLLSTLGVGAIIAAFALPAMDMYTSIDVSAWTPHAMGIGGLGFVFSIFGIIIRIFRDRRGIIPFFVAGVLFAVAIGIIRGTSWEFLTFLFSMM